LHAEAGLLNQYVDCNMAAANSAAAAASSLSGDFRTTKATGTVEEEDWWYEDASRNQQGPFALSAMKGWHGRTGAAPALRPAPRWFI
jgi:hypothetical protein